MNIAIIGKNKNTEGIRNILLDRLDNINVFCFETISSYTQTVTSRNVMINRVIVLQNALPVQDTYNIMLRFQRFVDDRNQRTSLIFIVKDLEVANNLNSIFVSILHCIVYTSTVTPPQLVQIASDEIKNVKERMGYKTEEDSYSVEAVEDITPKKQKKPEKKGGLLSGLFGKKKQDTAQKPPTDKFDEFDDLDDIEELDGSYASRHNYQDVDAETLEKNLVPDFTDDVQDVAFSQKLDRNRKASQNFYNPDKEIVQEKPTPKENNPIIEGYETSPINNQELQPTSVHTLGNPHNKKESKEKPIQLQQTPYEEIRTSVINNRDIIANNYRIKEEQPEEQVIMPATSQEITKEEDTPPFQPFEETIVETIEETAVGVVEDVEIFSFEEVTPIKQKQKLPNVDINEIDNKLKTLDREISLDEDIIVPHIHTNTHGQQLPSVETIETQVMDIDVRNLEISYEGQKQQPVQPQVIDEGSDKPVQRGMVRGIGGRRNIIVTGDRGSGLTTTALTIASMLARNETTLYVDFDVDQHGFVYYAGIDTLLAEDSYVQSGLTHLHRYDNIKAVTYRYHKGGFDAILSFLDSDITEEDIVRVQKILTLQRDYKNVVIDCPVDKLHLLKDMVEQATILVATRVSLKPIINTLTTFGKIEGSSMQYNVYKNARLLITDKSHPELLIRNLMYVRDLFSLDEVEIDWTDIPFIGSTNNMLALMDKLTK